MPRRPEPHRPPHWRSEAERKREFNERRGTPPQRGYDAAWQRFRRQVLQDEPLCRFCREKGKLTPATVVDHIVSIRERPDLRLDRSNVRALCKPCHDRRTARDQGFARRKAVK